MSEKNETQTIKHPDNFIDPYGEIPRKEKSRTTIDVAIEARADLSAIYPNKGYLQTTINILLEKLRKEFKKHGIDSYSPDTYKFAVGNCSIVLGGFEPVQPRTSGTSTIPRKPTRKRTTIPKSYSTDEVLGGDV